MHNLTDKQIEKDVLGTALNDPASYKLLFRTISTSDVFYHSLHKKVYQIAQKEHEKGNSVSTLEVIKRLRELDAEINKEELTGLKLLPRNPGHMEAKCSLLVEMYVKRKMYALGESILKDCSMDLDLIEMVSNAQKSLDDIRKMSSVDDCSHISEIAEEVQKDVQFAIDNPEKAKGVNTGLTNLNRLTGGWQKSDLIIIAGRPGMGKTAFALHCARSAAITGVNTMVFSLEMSNKQLVSRLISSDSSVNTQKASSGKLNLVEIQNFNTSVSKLSSWGIYMDDTAALHIDRIRSISWRMKEEYRIGLIIVDYLQLIKTSEKEIRISMTVASAVCKQIAKELDLPVILLSQLSRAVEARGGDKRPQLSDLKESGGIEEAADVVIFPYRPEYYGITEDEEGNSTEGVVEILVKKHRNGALADLKNGCDIKIGKYYELEIHRTNSSFSGNFEFDSESEPF